MATFAAALARDHKRVIWVWEIDGITPRFASRLPWMPGSTTFNATLDPMSLSGGKQSSSPQQGTDTTQTMTLSVIDADSTLTAELATIRGRTSRVYCGFADVQWSDYQVVFEGVVRELKWVMAGEWAVTLETVSGLESKVIFDLDASSNPITPTNPITRITSAYDHIMRILTSTGAGANGVYDVYPSRQGLAIDQAKIDIAGIEAERTLNPIGGRFLHEGPATGTAIIRKICKEFALWPFVTYDGLRSIKALRLTDAGDATTDWSDTDVIVGVPETSYDMDRLQNSVRLQYDWNTTTSKYDSLTIDDDANSQADPPTGFGRTVTHDVTTKWITTTNTGGPTIAARKNRILDRGKSPRARYTVTTFLSEADVSVGDLVRITHPSVPDPVAATRGVTNLVCEVYSRAILWRDGLMRFEIEEVL